MTEEDEKILSEYSKDTSFEGLAKEILHRKDEQDFVSWLWDQHIDGMLEDYAKAIEWFFFEDPENRHIIADWLKGRKK